MIKINEYLKQFLNVDWLRPETALWRTIDCIKLKDIKFNNPIIDVGCGDGIFSFVRAGGQFSIDFDMYLSVNKMNKFFNNEDIYNTFDKKKMIIDILKKPKYKIEFGLDWKKALLDKARLINLYDKLIRHDANQKIPIHDSSFNTVFSNIVYWLDDVESVVKELARIVTQDGKIVLMLPNKTIKQYYIYNQYLENGSLWARLLDRGRYKQIKSCYSYIDWKRIFDKVGLKIVFHDTHISRMLFKFWDIGLRPLSPVLIEMANSTSKLKRRRNKEKWINLCLKLARPFLHEEIERKDNLFHLFVLKKRRR